MISNISMIVGRGIVTAASSVWQGIRSCIVAIRTLSSCCRPQTNVQEPPQTNEQAQVELENQSIAQGDYDLEGGARAPSPTGSQVEIEFQEKSPRTRLTELKDRLTALTSQQELLVGQFTALAIQQESLEERVTALESQVASLGFQIESLKSQMLALESSSSSPFSRLFSCFKNLSCCGNNSVTQEEVAETRVEIEMEPVPENPSNSNIFPSSFLPACENGVQLEDAESDATDVETRQKVTKTVRFKLDEDDSGAQTQDSDNLVKAEPLTQIDKKKPARNQAPIKQRRIAQNEHQTHAEIETQTRRRTLRHQNHIELSDTSDAEPEPSNKESNS